MSTLRIVEKTQLEQLLGMASGYVLDLSNSTFQDLILETTGADIYADRYAFNGDSKANRLRAFWKIESDKDVGKVLAELIEYVSMQPNKYDSSLIENCKCIVKRLLGKQIDLVDSEKKFLDEDLTAVSLKNVITNSALLSVLQSRFTEAISCLRENAPLASIFLCGSILEGLLLDRACQCPDLFNKASSSPKDATGKVKKFTDWKLSEFIDTAYEVGCLSLDVKKFSHILREFRNYIHPYQQISLNFNPDKHTAQICIQVLRATIACLSGERCKKA